MSSTIKAVSRPKRQSSAADSAGFNSFLSRLMLAYRVYRERRALMSLSESALKDLGLSRADAYREGTRSIWDLPENRFE